MPTTINRILAAFLSLLLAVQGFTIPATGYAENALPDSAIETSPSSSSNSRGLRGDLESALYSQLIDELGDGCYIENVETRYISQEYLEEVAYNSQNNVYFGYTLAELDEAFEGARYVFTVEDGQTVAREYERLDEGWKAETLTNIAMGSGVILVCVTVALVTTQAAPAVSVIFAASAKGATELSLTSSLISAVVAGAVSQIQTGDFDAALQAAAVNGSDAFKWGAIIGSLAGGAGKAKALSGATLAGLTMNEAALIQRETRWSLDTIKHIGSMEEYNLYKSANLVETRIGNTRVLTRSDIDWNLIDESGRTNRQRVLQDGLAPIGSDGYAMEVHHIGQENGTTYALLTRTEHRGEGHSKILHPKTSSTVDHGSEFIKEVREIWKTLAEGAS